MWAYSMSESMQSRCVGDSGKLVQAMIIQTTPATHEAMTLSLIRTSRYCLSNGLFSAWYISKLMLARVISCTDPPATEQRSFFLVEFLSSWRHSTVKTQEKRTRNFAKNRFICEDSLPKKAQDVKMLRALWHCTCNLTCFVSFWKVHFEWKIKTSIPW